MTKSDALEGELISSRWSKFTSRCGICHGLAILALGIFLQGAAAAKTIYVNGAKATSGDGSSWDSSFVYLRDALDVSVAGDVVFVAKGIYYPDDGKSGYYGDRELSFEVNGVNIYGGFAGTESTIDERDVAANPTILSGEIWTVTPTTPGYERYWSLHVIILKASATLDGLTIERGRANGDTAPYNQGGGVLVTSGTLTLVNCKISECLAAQDGGAVYGDVVATGCTFSGNRSDNEFLLTDKKLNQPEITQHSWLYSPVCSGGAITGNVTANDCRFLNNHVRARSLNTGYTSSVTGGAIAGTVSARDCTFDGNTASSSSFGGYVNALATARGGAIAGENTVVNCIFTNNEANTIADNNPSPDPKKPVPYVPVPQSLGGAIAGKTGATNCVFSENTISSDARRGDWGDALSYGGAVYVEEASNILNCVFVGNDASHLRGWSGGGSIRASESAVIPVMNCTFLDCSTTGGGTCLSVGGNVKVLSNIFWSTAVEDPADPEVLIWVDGSGNSNARARISNRLYPTPSTETINIVKGGMAGIDVNFSNADFGEPPERTVLNLDPQFLNVAAPAGADGIWKTADDGLRVTAASPAIGKGHPLFLPLDIYDLDDDRNVTETSPVDVANFARIQDATMDLGAYEFGDILYAPEIQVEQPAASPLTDGLGTVNFRASTGSPDVKSFVIKNVGTLGLKRISVRKTGINSGDFNISQPLSTTLGPGATTTFNVSFSSSTAGIRTASLRVVSNDADENPFDIALEGEMRVPDIAVEYPVGTDLTDDVSVIDYGTVAALSSVAKTFTIRNMGLGDLKITGITSTGASAGDYKVSGPAQTKLIAGETTTFRVVFSPTAKGTRAATISIKCNDPDQESTFAIKLTGNGIVAPEIAVYQPSSVGLVDGGTKSFGSVKTGLSYTKSFIIKNVGSDKLKISSVSLSGSGTFTKTQISKNNLDPGEKTSFTVTFRPKSNGLKTAALKINSNDSDESPFDIKLNGTGYSASSSAAKSALVDVSSTSTKLKSAGNSGVLTVAKASDGLEYLVLTVAKTPDWITANHQVEVSSNLVDWFSGEKHTTTLLDDAAILRVRDNTPVKQGEKRYIRLK